MYSNFGCVGTEEALHIASRVIVTSPLLASNRNAQKINQQKLRLCLNTNMYKRSNVALRKSTLVGLSCFWPQTASEDDKEEKGIHSVGL